MLRQIIRIDIERCNGCGICAKACFENAIVIENGKAVLLRDDFCDGMGKCLPACPQNAISFEEREAAAYDEMAVKKHQTNWKLAKDPEIQQTSQLGNWPVQMRLAPVQAPFYQGAHLLVAADCTAYACAAFHEKYMHGKVTLIGCPKLDATDYAAKLSDILKNNDIRSVSIVRMQVPCCGRLADEMEMAVESCGKEIPLEMTILPIRE